MRKEAIERASPYFFSCLLSVLHACDWGVETHTYIMLEIQGTITYLLLCNVKLHFRSPTVSEFSMRFVIVPTIKLLTELTGLNAGGAH